MKNNFLGTLLIGALFAGLPTIVNAADAEQSRKPHDQLKRLVGNWTTEMTSFFPDPSAPKVTKGRANFKMILGGNFVQQRFFGEVDGKKYEGIGISGYDTAKKKYVGTWKDSLNTGIMHVEGTYDVKSHTLTEFGEMSSPGGTMKTKNTTKYIDKNNFVFTMYMITPEGEQKIFSINYTRAKDDSKPKKKKNE
jgi:hypothetical protein